MQDTTDQQAGKAKNTIDPLSMIQQQAKLEKESQVKGDPKKQQGVVANTFQDPDNDDLFQEKQQQQQLENQSKTLNFNTVVVQEKKIPSRTITFGADKHKDLFGVTPQEYQNNQSKSPISSNQQQQNGFTSKNKSVLNFGKGSQQKNGSPRAQVQQQPKQLNFSSSGLQQGQSGQQSVQQQSYQHISRTVQQEKEYMSKLGVQKYDYHEGERHITHIECQGKFYDTKNSQWQYSEGKLILTSYMIRFVPNTDVLIRNKQRSDFFQLPLGFINKVVRSQEKKGILYSYLDIYSKDYREFSFRFQQTQGSESQEIMYKIQRYCFPEEKQQFFAYHFFHHNSGLEEQQRGWDVYSIDREFERLGVKIAPLQINLDGQQTQIPEQTEEDFYEFRYVDNSKGQICSTYPFKLIVPYQMTDEQIFKTAKFRSRERLAVLSYAQKNPYKNMKNKYVSLWRCAQCKTGLANNRSFEDEMYLRTIGDCTEKPEKSNTNFYNCHIYDARPKMNAVGMQIAGKGFESTEFYKNCQISFLNIGNIHKVRDSQKAIVKAVTSDQLKYVSNLEKSGYFEMIQYIIEGANKIVAKLGQGINVVTHCSDGWDRTSQLCSLVQIILDPYYRTMTGFQVLIEKEWVSYGYQFALRCGHGNKDHTEEQRSPVFTQFLEVVHQLLHQFPLSFQFNQKFLIDINYHTYSLLFGTFLCNNAREQQLYEIKNKTISLWSYMNQLEMREKYVNPFYLVNDMIPKEITPSADQMDMKLWKEYFKYYQYGSKDQYGIHMECNFNEDNISIIHKQSKYKSEQQTGLLTQNDEKMQEILSEFDEKLKARENVINDQKLQLQQMQKEIQELKKQQQNGSQNQ